MSRRSYAAPYGRISPAVLDQAIARAQYDEAGAGELR
jgi:hypothetical protein